MIEEWSEQVIESMAKEFSKSVDAEAIKEVLRLYRALLIQDAVFRVESVLRTETLRQRLSDLSRKE